MRGAISMSRLDQLAQPRRRRFLPSTPETIKNVSPSTKSKSRSMSNIAFGHTLVPTQSRPPRTKPPISRSSSSTSMPHSDCRTPSPSKRSNPKSSPPSSNLTKKSISMVHLASTPRPTKASKMRADALLSKENGLNKSMFQINNCMSTEVRGEFIKKKDTHLKLYILTPHLVVHNLSYNISTFLFKLIQDLILTTF